MCLVSSPYAEFAPMSRNRRSLSLTPPTQAAGGDGVALSSMLQDWSSPATLEDAIALNRTQRSKY